MKRTLVYETKDEGLNPSLPAKINKEIWHDINLNLRYRVCVINDFDNSVSVVDCKKFGVVMITDAWRVGSEHKGYQLPEDDIGIFLNYKLLHRTKSREEANKLVDKLIGEAPKELLSEFEQFIEYLK